MWNSRLGTPDRAWMCPLRSQQHGLVKVESPDGHETWVAVSYRAVRQVVFDPTFSRAHSYEHPLSWLNGWFPRQAILGLDGTEHIRLRTVLNDAMNLRSVEGIRSGIRAIVEKQLDRLTATAMPADFIGVFAGPVAALSIAELLGVPDPDPEKLRRWSEVVMSIDVYNSQEISQTSHAIPLYAARLAAIRRRHADGRVISNLVHDKRLTNDDVQNLIRTMMIAGIDNLTIALGHCMMKFSGLPDKKQVTADSDALQRAIEEVLRVHPVGRFLFPRMALRDVVVDGVLIPRGALVVGSLTSANNDERRFDDPTEFDPGRRRNHHLSFGHGPHFCAGASMSRMVLAEALCALFKRVPAIVPAEGCAIEPRVGYVADGFQQLPVIW